jgi:hypothetical protein
VAATSGIRVNDEAGRFSAADDALGPSNRRQDAADALIGVGTGVAAAAAPAEGSGFAPSRISSAACTSPRARLSAAPVCSWLNPIASKSAI